MRKLLAKIQNRYFFNKTFDGVVLHLDNRIFIGCAIRNCHIIYGGGWVRMTGCLIDRGNTGSITFTKHAANTALLMEEFGFVDSSSIDTMVGKE